MRKPEVPQSVARAIFPLAAAALLLAVPLFTLRPAEAAASFVQGTAAIGTSVTLNSTATAGDLLVVICADNVSSTMTGPSGYTQIINEAGTVSQAMFYKIAAGGEKTGIGCTFTDSGTEAVQVLEYSGLHGYSTVETSTSSSGSGTTISTGTLTTTHANDLLVAAGIINTGNVVTWTSPFTNEASALKSSGNPSTRDAVSSSDNTVTTTGSYSASGTSASSAAWRGQLVAFRVLDANPALTFDIVNASGATVSNPTATLGSISPTFACQTVTGSLGSSTARLRVTNTTDNPSWTVTMAATGGSSAVWSAATTPPHSYKFNDATGSGCTNGQLTVDATAGTLSAGSGCVTTGVNKGASSAFTGSTAVTILNAASPAYIDCYWELTNIGISQKIPAGQLGGNYTLGMTLTITAN